MTTDRNSPQSYPNYKLYQGEVNYVIDWSHSLNHRIQEDLRDYLVQLSMQYMNHFYNIQDKK